MHNFKLGDKVSVGGFEGPFDVIGIRPTTVEVAYPDKHAKAAWVNHTKIRPYKEPLTQEYIDGLIKKYERLESVYENKFFLSVNDAESNHYSYIRQMCKGFIKDLKRE